MYCPKCGQQQVSDEMRFCSRCGLPLSGLADWIAGGAIPAKRVDEPQRVALSARRKAMRRAGKLMFFSGVLAPVFLGISLVFDEAGPMIVPFIMFFFGLAMMLYARLLATTPRPWTIHYSITLQLKLRHYLRAQRALHYHPQQTYRYQMWAVSR